VIEVIRLLVAFGGVPSAEHSADHSVMVMAALPTSSLTWILATVMTMFW
jgi:hypothetical protein